MPYFLPIDAHFILCTGFHYAVAQTQFIGWFVMSEANTITVFHEAGNTLTIFRILLLFVCSLSVLDHLY